MANNPIHQASYRTIYRSSEERRIDELAYAEGDSGLPCAYHVTNAFDPRDLKKLDDLRRKIPLDLSRPTCPRRFLTEKKSNDDAGGGWDEESSSVDAIRQHREDGWVGALIDAAVSSWDLPHRFVSLPWYRYLEYTEPGGHMEKHADGSNVHPTTGARSVATMLIYLSTCREGGETTLYRKKKKKWIRRRNGRDARCDARSRDCDGSPDSADTGIVESIRPMYNTVLIFPHSWMHSGDPVVEDAKIALRVDLTWKV